MESLKSVSVESKARKVKGLTYTSHSDLSTWPTPGVLSPDKRSRYLDRKKAVEMYLDGESDERIHAKCGIGLKQAYRLITERCLSTHPDGRIYGWRGLVPNLRIKAYRRNKPIAVDAFGLGAAGALNAVLDMHPQLRTKLDERILASAGPEELGVAKRPRQAHWKWFLDELRKLGYEMRREWPFDTETVGYSSICRYIDRVIAANPKKAARVVGGPELERKLRAGDGVDRPVYQLLDRVEMDAHKLDGRFCVMLPQPSGGYVAKIVHRLWVLVILEVVR